MRHHPLRKIIAGLLSVLLSLLPVPVLAENITERFSHTFNGLGNEEGFTENHSLGMSYVTGRMQTYQNAVRINTCDMRWWSLYYYDDYMHFEYSLSFDENYEDTVLYFNIQNHTASTTTESHNGGVVTMVLSDGGTPYLTDRNGSRLMDFAKDGTVYRIRVSMTYGSDQYAVYCNDTLLSDTCRFVSPVYGIFGLRYHGASTSSSSYLTLDDLYFSTEGQTYPQKYSYQEPGEIPAMHIPEVPAENGITFWHNGVEYGCPVDIALTDGTVYLPIDWITEVLGNADLSAEIVSSDSAGTVLNTEHGSVSMNHPFYEENGQLMVSAQYIAELYEARVWLDETHEMLIVTTGSHRDDNILRKYGHVLVQNGEPFYEISFNKFDLNWQIAEDPSISSSMTVSPDFASPQDCRDAAEESLRQLSENGFRTIRVFCRNIHMGKSQQELDAFFAAADTMYDLCDTYGIQVVACMDLLSTEFLPGAYVDEIGWINSRESFYDLLTDPESESRTHLYDFIDAYVSRYKDRDTILMWEIVNEGNLGADIGYQVQSIAYSLGQLGTFYCDVADRIRLNDPERLVSSGDSVLRGAQWNLYEGTMSGLQSPDWTTDTWEERLKALMVLNEGVDVLSVHGYSVGNNEMYIDENNRLRYTTWELLLAEAERLGLALYNGETGGMIGDNGVHANLPNTGTESADARVNYLDTIVDAGVQLTHWWTFHSNRATFGYDVDTFSVRTDDDTAPTFAAIKEANEKLQAKYKVNPLAAENTTVLHDALTSIPTAETSSEPEIDGTENHDTAEKTGSTAEKTSLPLVITAVGIVVILGSVCGITVLRRKKK